MSRCEQNEVYDYTDYYDPPQPIDTSPLPPLDIDPPELLESRLVCSLAESWAKIWGEAVNIKTACQMLGTSRWTVRRWLNEGLIQETPDGRVVVRSAAAYINSGPTPQQRIPATQNKAIRANARIPKFIP